MSGNNSEFDGLNPTSIFSLFRSESLSLSLSLSLLSGLKKTFNEELIGEHWWWWWWGEVWARVLPIADASWASGFFDQSRRELQWMLVGWPFSVECCALVNVRENRWLVWPDVRIKSGQNIPQKVAKTDFNFILKVPYLKLAKKLPNIKATFVIIFLNGPILASFCLFSLFSWYNFNNTNWKKHRWSAWDMNPGPQDGRHRQNHGAMAATR